LLLCKKEWRDLNIEQNLIKLARQIGQYMSLVHKITALLVIRGMLKKFRVKMLNLGCKSRLKGEAYRFFPSRAEYRYKRQSERNEMFDP
jgi:hypothetical protein